MTLAELIERHAKSKPPRGAWLLRVRNYEVSVGGEVLGMVAADSIFQARANAADRWGGPADAYGVRYVSTSVEWFRAPRRASHGT